MILYRLVLVAKLLGVMGYAGGLLASFIATDAAERKRAVHHIASPSLLATWCAGYVLLQLSGVRFFELWVAGGLVLSVVSNAVLVYCVSRNKRGVGAFLGAAAPVIATVVLMIFKPTWAQVTA